MIYLDTHVVAWMFGGRTDLIPAAVLRLCEERDLLVSPVVGLELQYLFELDRTAKPARVVLQTLEREIGLKLCDLPFSRVIDSALAQSWTRDPFDRIIVSHAALRKATLVTKDRSMRDHYPRAIWGD